MDENREIGKNIFLVDSIPDETSHDPSGFLPLAGDVAGQSGINGFSKAVVNNDSLQDPGMSKMKPQLWLFAVIFFFMGDFSLLYE